MPFAQHVTTTVDGSQNSPSSDVLHNPLLRPYALIIPSHIITYRNMVLAEALMYEKELNDRGLSLVKPRD